MLTSAQIRPQFVAATLLWLTALAVDAEDWPQWRGPNRDGVWSETGLAATFPADGLKVRWRAPVGPGFSSPVIAGGRVIVTDSQIEKPKGRDRVLCFDEKTGKPLWTYTHDVTPLPDWVFTSAPGQEQGPNATPIVRDGRAYAVGSLAQNLYCLDASTGGVLWEKNLEKEFHLPESTNGSASPMIDGDLLILFVGAKPGACVVALDKNSGKVVWTALDEFTAHSSPVIVSAGGVRQLIVWTVESVTGLDPASGRLLWRERFPGSSMTAVPTPVFAGDRLLLGGLMLKLAADKPGESVLWPEAISKRSLSSTSTPMLRGGLVFSAKDKGEFICLDATTGGQLWENKTVTDLTTAATIHITANGDTALIFNDRGELIRARLDADGYHEISRALVITPAYPFGGRKVVWTPPSYANGHIFARNEKEIVCASLQP